MAISLAGHWMLHDAAGVLIGPCPIPGDVHSALIAAGRIPDPMIGRNEADVQWVGEATWEIRRRFRLDGAEIAGKWAVLDLEFVDTIADVIINEFDVARISSSFIRHRLDVSDVIRAGENEIVLRFVSAAKEAHALAARQPFPIPCSVSNNRIADMNMVRKAQCHAGWDWGLCLMVLGVYAEPKLTSLRRRAHRARLHPPEAPRQRQGDRHRRGRDRRGQGADDPGHLHLRRGDRFGQRRGDPRRRQGVAVDRPRQAGAVVAGRPRRAAAPRRRGGDPRRPGRARGRPAQARGRQPSRTKSALRCSSASTASTSSARAPTGSPPTPCPSRITRDAHPPPPRERACRPT